MKRLLLISMLFGAMPLALLAQDDDLYFVPKKVKTVEPVTDNYGLPKDTYYSGSDRTVDEYNRRMKSSYVPVDSDSTMVDVIDFELTKKMTRFDDYDLTNKAAYWAGYERGRLDWGWHSPWYYPTYSWYGGWYDPFYYNWYGRLYPWYDSWYYRGWYDPWYYGWGYPYYNYPYYPVYYGGGVSHPAPRYRSPRQPFASERSSFGNSSGRSSGRGSFGASQGARPSSRSNNPTYNGSRGSFGASRSSSSSGSYSSSRGSSGGGGSFGGGGGGSHSGGGGGGFGRHR